jgi:hypothetical protein
MQWARLHHVITHIATLWRRPTRRQRRAGDDTGRHHTDLLLVWNEAARAAELEKSALRLGVRRQRQGAGSPTSPTHHPTSRRCHGPPAWRQPSGSAGPAGAPCTWVAWSTRSCPHRAAPPAPCPGTWDNITFTDASRLRVARRAHTCSPAQQPGSTSTAHGDADRPWHAAGGDTVNHASWQRSTGHRASPDAHIATDCLSALCQIRRPCTTSAGPHARHARYWGRSELLHEVAQVWEPLSSSRSGRSGCAGDSDLAAKEARNIDEASVTLTHGDVPWYDKTHCLHKMTSNRGSNRCNRDHEPTQTAQRPLGPQPPEPGAHAPEPATRQTRSANTCTLSTTWARPIAPSTTTTTASWAGSLMGAQQCLP